VLVPCVWTSIITPSNKLMPLTKYCPLHNTAYSFWAGFLISTDYLNNVASDSIVSDP
jgi:hypothetical protein